MFTHYTTQAKEIGKELLESFENTQLTTRQLWLVVKLAKLARRSCRHNTAFNAAFSEAFPYAKFEQIPKKNEKTGKIYQGLSITVNDKTITDDIEDEHS